jgi:APA family basic amino acid/polyamine antiporter
MSQLFANMSQLFATKSLDDVVRESGAEGEGSLRRVLGRWDLVALGIGAVIGAGIFIITGTAAARFAGPSISLSFILAGLGCALAGLCYAEFATLIPVAGSAYTYGYATLGEIFAWIIGWDLILEYAFSAATVASGWSANMVSLLQDFGIHLPPQYTDTPGTLLVFFQNRWEPLATIGPALRAAGVDPASLPSVTAAFNLPAFLAVLTVTSILVVGIKESASFNLAVVFVKVGTVLTFIVVAGSYLLRRPEVAAANWTPFLPPNEGSFGAFGLSGIARGAAVIFFAYVGFDAVSTAAQEAKNPQRDMPFGLLASLGICTVLYIAVAAILTGIVHYSRLDVAAPVAVGIDATGVAWGSLLVKVGAIAGTSTVMLVTLLGQSRVFFSMSRDGLLPPWAGAIHPKFRTPWISSIITGLFVAGFAGTMPIAILGQLVSIGTLLAFVIVCAAILLLRKKRPDLERPFRTPLVPFVPLLGILVFLLLMASLPLDTWIRLVVWLLLGFAIYFGYGIRHSRLRARVPWQ